MMISDPHPQFKHNILSSHHFINMYMHKSFKTVAFHMDLLSLLLLLLFLNIQCLFKHLAKRLFRGAFPVCGSCKKIKENSVPLNNNADHHKSKQCQHQSPRQQARHIDSTGNTLTKITIRPSHCQGLMTRIGCVHTQLHTRCKT